MEILKTILIVIYTIVCLALIIISLMQNSQEDGASSAIVGGSSSSFYEKNKGRTKEGKLKKWTIILGITFIVMSVLLGIYALI